LRQIPNKSHDREYQGHRMERRAGIMHTRKKFAAWRMLPAAPALCLTLILAACGTVHPTGEGAALSADGHLGTIRSKNGLPALASDPVLEQAALQQAGYMARAGRMTHTTRLGRDFLSPLRDNNIQGAAAENIAFGHKDFGDLLNGWMNSSGHRRNMLDPRFRKYGLAYVREGSGKGRRYWALVLGR
jgi:uncharacterized protein YkwD